MERSLLYLTIHNRNDIAYAIDKLSRSQAIIVVNMGLTEWTLSMSVAQLT